jgi:polar amino acid transport system substrate-binding protein
MQTKRRFAALVTVFGLALAACSSGASPTPSAAPSVAPSVAPSTAASEAPSAAPSAAASVDPNSLLGKVLAKGTIVMSTDPQYPPQSSLKKDGTFEGFDIDVGSEIAKRLGVTITFQTPDWNIITAGSWAGRWDFSVGSMTITPQREKVLAFSKPYYFTPAQMAASTASGITTLDGLAGKVICAGDATTYYDWLTGSEGRPSVTATPPAGSTATTLSTDRLCADAWKAGRKDFQGWLSSSTTVEQAIKDGLPLVKVGGPVYNEPLGVAFDKGGPDPTAMVAKVNEILDAMRADGTLKTLSMKWFGSDMTVAPGS